MTRRENRPKGFSTFDDEQGMTAQQVNTLNTKLNELRALTVRAQISNILTAQHVADVEWALRQASLESPRCGCAVIAMARSGRVVAGFFRDEKNT